ncbi:MAG: FliH/SctL family protein [Kangiellaceae bacterium]|nr:FliH/SctL family protein [Kangiellaceae bacterium]MCW8997668.1 FliH/SctL family protein [Kangiellaceae bacterium]
MSHLIRSTEKQLTTEEINSNDSTKLEKSAEYKMQSFKSEKVDSTQESGFVAHDTPSSHVNASANQLLEKAYEHDSGIGGVEAEGDESNNEGQLAIDDAFARGKKTGEEEGYNQGYASGVKDGILQGKKEALAEYDNSLSDIKNSKQVLEKSVNSVNGLLEILQNKVDQETSVLETVGAELVFEVLTKIIGKKSEDKTMIEDILRQCLQQTMNNKIVKIRVSIEDYQFITSNELNVKLKTLLSSVEIKPDPQVSLGGCVVETDSGNLDARLENQLEIFKNYLVAINQGINKE